MVEGEGALADREAFKEGKRMSRNLDAAIAEALGYEVEWKDATHDPECGGLELAYWEDHPDDELAEGTKEIYYSGQHGGLPPVKQPFYRDEYGYWEIVPFYHEDGNAMLELDKEMRERGWWLETWSERNFCCAAYDRGSTYHKAAANTEPLARALAAYKALKGEEWVS